MMFKIFLSTIFKVLKIEFQVMPNEFNWTCVGSHTDLKIVVNYKPCTAQVVSDSLGSSVAVLSLLDCAPTVI